MGTYTAGGQVCAGGDCGCPSSTPDTCSGQCVNETSDPKNCGSCGKTCISGDVCQNSHCSCLAGTDPFVCNGQCTDLATDRNNCGGCGKGCASGQSCVDRQCVCDTGLSLCNGQCVNLLFDNANCNTCNHACDTAHGYHCNGGQCVPQP